MVRYVSRKGSHAVGLCQPQTAADGRRDMAKVKRAAALAFCPRAAAHRTDQARRRTSRRDTAGQNATDCDLHHILSVRSLLACHHPWRCQQPQRGWSWPNL
jgi:hypothetical protein